MSKRLGELLDDLIQQTFLDADEEWEHYSPATNSIRNAIIERYGRVDDADSWQSMPRRMPVPTGLGWSTLTSDDPSVTEGKVDSEQSE